MFDFGGDGAEEAATPSSSRPEAGDGGSTPARARSGAPPNALELGPIEPEGDGFEPLPMPGQDAVTALLPVLKDISRQFAAYTEAMETAVRDLAETENDLQTELQSMVRRARQVLAAHGQMRHRFTDRLGRVSRCLRAQQGQEQQGRRPVTE